MAEQGPPSNPNSAVNDSGELDEDEQPMWDDPDFRLALEELERKWFKEAVIFHKHLVRFVAKLIIIKEN